MIHTASRLNAEAAEDTGHGALFQGALSVGPGEVFGILGQKNPDISGGCGERTLER